MLDVAAAQPPMDPGHSGRLQEPVDAQLLSTLIAIEVAAGTPKILARASAQAALGDRDAALAAISLPAPPPMSDGELRERVDRLCARFTSLGFAEAPDNERSEPWQDAAE